MKYYISILIAILLCLSAVSAQTYMDPDGVLVRVAQGDEKTIDVSLWDDDQAYNSTIEVGVYNDSQEVSVALYDGTQIVDTTIPYANTSIDRLIVRLSIDVSRDAPSGSYEGYIDVGEKSWPLEVTVREDSGLWSWLDGQAYDVDWTWEVREGYRYHYAEMTTWGYLLVRVGTLIGGIIVIWFVYGLIFRKKR